MTKYYCIKPQLFTSVYDGKFLKENEIFHHTFCLIISKSNKAEMFLVDKLSLKTLGVYLFIISELKSNFNHAIWENT